MNASEQLELAERLRAALAGAGILIEDASRGSNGQIVRWEPVPAIQVLGVLMRHGWKISPAGAPVDRPPLHLHRPGLHREGHEL